MKELWKTLWRCSDNEAFYDFYPNKTCGLIFLVLDKIMLNFWSLGNLKWSLL